MSASPARRPRCGFTLVELLAVLGVVAILIALLLPSLALARHSSQRTRCMGNLRDLGAATLNYASENRGHFPAAASAATPRPDDWIYWDAARVPRHERGALVHYLDQGTFLPDHYRCPADALEDHIAYPYSYTMNRTMSGARLGDVRHAERKILFVEENPRAIDDGAWAADVEPYDHRNPLSPRHDRETPGSSNAGLGNLLFTDGHVEFHTPDLALDRHSWDPAY
jgi:prepilin-type N-terminal cleavage/methylation domain-containing protein/prepilin-type processing-associated H-X9-DG protein